MEKSIGITCPHLFQSARSDGSCAVGRHHTNFAGVGIGADERMTGPRQASDGQERQQRATEEK